jgi:hypothetical protein
MKPEDDDATIPNAQSTGNQGARGSRGQANSGALPGSPDAGANEREPVDHDPDLRKAPAQGGGGKDSASSRSQ